MKKLCLLGHGKMGKTLESLADNEGFTVSYIYDGENTIDLYKLKECDVAIDFSTPHSAVNNIETCINHNIPVVSGTTGWLDKMPQIQKLLDENPQSTFMYGSNFSIGANIFFFLNKYLAKLMKTQNYELDIKEIHHTTKLDAPSGTAISIANDIIDILPKKEKWVNENSKDPAELSIISIREEDVKGTHIVRFQNEIDEIKIEHKAKTRNGFAIGALKAANWLVGKNGFYTVQDFIQAELETN